MTKRPKAAERDDISYTTKVGWLLAHNSVRPTVDTRGGVWSNNPIMLAVVEALTC